MNNGRACSLLAVAQWMIVGCHVPVFRPWQHIAFLRP